MWIIASRADEIFQSEVVTEDADERTSTSMKESFLVGYGGLAGPGFYVCSHPDDAMRRSRNGSVVVFAVEIWGMPQPCDGGMGNWVIRNPGYEISVSSAISLNSFGDLGNLPICCPDLNDRQ